MNMTTTIMNLMMGTNLQGNQGQLETTDGMLFTKLLGKAMKSGHVDMESTLRQEESDLEPEEALKEVLGALGVPVTLPNNGQVFLTEEQVAKVDQWLGDARAKAIFLKNSEEPLTKEQVEELLKKVQKERTLIETPMKTPKENGCIDIPRDPTIRPLEEPKEKSKLEPIKEVVEPTHKVGEISLKSEMQSPREMIHPVDPSKDKSWEERMPTQKEPLKAEDMTKSGRSLEESIKIHDGKPGTMEDRPLQDIPEIEEGLAPRTMQEAIELKDFAEPLEKHLEPLASPQGSTSSKSIQRELTDVAEKSLQPEVIEMRKQSTEEPSKRMVSTIRETMQGSLEDKEVTGRIGKETTFLKDPLLEMDAKLYRRNLGNPLGDKTYVQSMGIEDEMKVNITRLTQEVMPMEKQISFKELIQKQDPEKITAVPLGESGLQEIRKPIDGFTSPKTFEPMVLEENLKNAEALILKSMNTLKEGDRTTMKLRLHPEDLGEMEVVLTLDKGKLSGRFITENLEMKNLFQEKIQELTQNLKAHQIDVSKMEVSTNMQGSKEDGPKDPRQHQTQTAAMANIRGYGKIQKEVTTYIHVPEQHKEHINLLA